MAPQPSRISHPPWWYLSAIAVAGSANSSIWRQALKVSLLHQVSQLLRRDSGLDVQVASDILQQLEHSRHLALREQVDLQIEMAALISLASEPILAGQDE